MDNIYCLRNGNFAKDISGGKGRPFLIGLSKNEKLYFPGAIERGTLNTYQKLGMQKVIQLKDIQRISKLLKIPCLNNSIRLNLASEFLIPDPTGELTSESKHFCWEMVLRLNDFVGDYFQIIVNDLEPGRGIETFKIPYWEYLNFLEDSILLHAV